MANIVYNEDCMIGMARYPDKYFDLAIVDPPYSDMFTTKACADNLAPKGKYNIHSLNGNKPTDEYFTELKRVSKNQIIWGANWYEKYFGVGGIVWFKNNSGNYSPCEYAYQSFNNHVYHFEFTWNGMLQGNMAEKETRIHPTQKPIALYDWLIQHYAKPTDKILDTHVGSGSSRIAADKHKIDFTGFEIDAEYWQAQESRFERYKAQGVLF